MVEEDGRKAEKQKTKGNKDFDRNLVQSNGPMGRCQSSLSPSQSSFGIAPAPTLSHAGNLCVE